MKKLIWGFLLIVILNCGMASADTHYVSPYGNDTYPYTSWETAADSIQKGKTQRNIILTSILHAGDNYLLFIAHLFLNASRMLRGGNMIACRYYYSNTVRRSSMSAGLLDEKDRQPPNIVNPIYGELRTILIPNP